MAQTTTPDMTARATAQGYDEARAILSSLRPADPDDDFRGLVGEVDTASLWRVSDALEAAGYTVSDSCDDEGACWIWVSSEAAEAEIARADASRAAAILGRRGGAAGKGTAIRSAVAKRAAEARWAKARPAK